ncbi:MAG TPA: hypothetical protein VL856_08775, partial [Acidimicrobiia bacterium]|nr:hypothetical protein [Acidimicrobiia bacterium]
VELLYEGTSIVKKSRIAMLISEAFFTADRPLFERATDEFDAATFTDLRSACAYLEVSTTAVQPVLDALRQELRASL